MDPRSYFILTSAVTDTPDYSTVWGVPSYVWWIVIAILLLVSGLFSASENAYSNCNKYHFKTLSNKGNFTAKLIIRLIDKFDSTLVTVLVSNNIVQTFMSFLSALLFYNLCEEYALGSGVEAILSTVVMAFLVYVVSDTVPKILSKAIPNRMAYILAYPVTIFGIILYPIIWIFDKLLLVVHKIFKIKDENLLSKDDLIHSASVAVNVEEPKEDEEDESEKLFENDEKDLLSNVFTFDKLKVRNVYTPKEKVYSINIEGLTCEVLNKLLLEIPYSRIPIYDETEDNIIGILVLKTYFEEYAKDTHLDIRSILENAISIDVNENIDEVFKILNKEKVHLGIVFDGEKMIGVISMEDILEELVDDIDEKPIANLKEVKDE